MQIDTIKNHLTQREKNSRTHVTSKIITGDATAPVESMVSVPNSLGDSKVIGPDNSPPIPPASCVSVSGQVSHVPIKISKFPENRNIIYEAVRKRFPFLSWTKSITKYQDHFEYTNSEAKCPACTSIHTHRGIWVIGLAKVKIISIILCVPGIFIKTRKSKLLHRFARSIIWPKALNANAQKMIKD
ncbi:hypothetical protein RCL_jg22750.t1 [Rhizophagus clarus]|uniref:Uncharacterized protein n=1 Tax=Rhizophagus clarus TaxID=94130 RepID=A0A8H3QMB4_9GLOM|nr:hypothetical protein RCL_jg22750.t1 [Rhizophagus clarus]